MKEKTDLKAVRSVANVLLLTDVHETEFSPLIVQHPFTATGLVGIRRNGETAMVDITKDAKSLREWQDFISGQIEIAGSVRDIYNMINKPYAMTFVKYAKHHLSREDFSDLLADAWMRSENPNNDANLSKGELVAMFKAADQTCLMEASELNELHGLDDTVTVYRGVTPYNGKNIRALSWTLEPRTAEWFANRFGEEGTVYEATIDKSHILALFNGRNEAEVIVDPKYLRDIEETQEIDEGLSLQ